MDDEGLALDDIDYVFLSHRHPDHTLLACLFKKAKYITFDDHLVYDNDIILEFNKNILGKDIEIIDTPGHVLEHLSLVVDTADGKVVVAGDVIWWLDDEKQIFNIKQKDHTQAADMDIKALIKSRRKLLKIADYIIPGHGKMFKVDKNLKNI